MNGKYNKLSLFYILHWSQSESDLAISKIELKNLPKMQNRETRDFKTMKRYAKKCRE